MDSSTPQWGGLTSKEVRSSGCSWHGVGWAEATLLIWTTLLSRTLLWGSECLVDEQQLLRRMPTPPLRQFLHDPVTESFHVFWLFGFDGYRTNSLLKGVKVQSEVAYLNWHFGSARQKHGIYRPSIIMEMWTPRREWKLWETDQLGIHNVTLFQSLHCRSIWRGMSTRLFGLFGWYFSY